MSIDDVGDVGAKDNEGRVGNIDDVENAEGDRNATGDRGVEAADQETRDDGIDEKREGKDHYSVPGPGRVCRKRPSLARRKNCLCHGVKLSQACSGGTAAGTMPATRAISLRFVAARPADVVSQRQRRSQASRAVCSCLVPGKQCGQGTDSTTAGRSIATRSQALSASEGARRHPV